MGGRRPKPTRLKLLEGTTRADRAREGEPEPSDGEIIRPDFLKYREVELWDQYAPALIAMGTLKPADVHLFAEWCQLTVKMETDKTSGNERAQRRLLGAELGIGAGARAKLGTRGKSKTKDPADAFFQAG